MNRRLLRSRLTVMAVVGALAAVVAPGASASCTTPATEVTTGVCQVIFSSSGTFAVPRGVTAVNLLLVGGGGAGDGDAGSGLVGGGGGGGEVRVVLASPVTAETNVSVVVGAGGIARVRPSPSGTNGQSTSFGSVTALGGLNAADGVGGTSGANAGGTGAFNGGGGGGGASSAGANAASSTGGAGGSGTSVSSAFPGLATTRYGGGGGGAGSSTLGTASDGGGSGGKAGGNPLPFGTAGTANTGGGGGGGYGRVGAVGGSGIVVVRFDAPPDEPTPTPTETPSTATTTPTTATAAQATATTSKPRALAGGRAQVTVQASGGGVAHLIGTVKLSTGHATRVACEAHTTFAAAGTAVLTCRASAATRRLRRLGAVRLRLELVFTPTGGTAVRSSAGSVLLPRIADVTPAPAPSVVTG